jgi:hypothetical protein
VVKECVMALGRVALKVEVMSESTSTLMGQGEGNLEPLVDEVRPLRMTEEGPGRWGGGGAARGTTARTTEKARGPETETLNLGEAVFSEAEAKIRLQAGEVNSESGSGAGKEKCTIVVAWHRPATMAGPTHGGARALPKANTPEPSMRDRGCLFVKTQGMTNGEELWGGSAQGIDVKGHLLASSCVLTTSTHPGMGVLISRMCARAPLE